MRIKLLALNVLAVAILVDSALAGNVYVTSPGSNAVVELGPNLNFITNFGQANLSSPQGLAFNSAGDLYVASNTGSVGNGGSVTEFDPNHNVIATSTGYLGVSGVAIFPTPEPASWVMASIGMCALAAVALARRNRRA